ncbi:hypothetical protein [Sulfitobacter sp. JB4-11]|uniref:hypothetical protein n=1 Tax=Sulfitobacter rhodophyticola TaxID=3238304 RepID=UPI003D8175A9
MMKRVLLSIAAGVVLAACQPAVPDSGRGVGFDGTLEDLQRQRDAQLAGQIVPAPAVVSAQPLESSSLAPAPGSAAATAAETQRVLAATRRNPAIPAPQTSVAASGASIGLGNDLRTNSGQEPLQASPSNAPPELVNTAGISRENNFDAVSSQRSIEGDAARLARNRAQYEVVQPEALPSRTGTGPNVVAYALQTSHPRGTQVYRRIGLNKASKFQRACAQHATSDEAQIAFLSQGGPERDRQGMDPDGDGYACNWDPAPFRRAAQQG